MLTIHIPEQETFNNVTETFHKLPQLPPLHLEHSLIAISKWEAKYRVPFLRSVEYLSADKHKDKFHYYISCMSTKGELSQEVFERLTSENFLEITKYIADPHTASIISSSSFSKGGGGKHVPTAERIYAIMAVYRIPHEYSKWHINNLFAVIDFCREYNEDPKKRKAASQDDVKAYYEQNEKIKNMGIAL